MPLPPQLVDQAFRSTRVNRSLGSGVANYINTATQINSLPLDHDLSKDELHTLRDQLVKNYMLANLGIDRKRLMLQNLAVEERSVTEDNASSDRRKEALKKKSILLTRRVSQLKQNVLKIERINHFIRSFRNDFTVLDEEKFNKIFKDLGVREDDRRLKRLGNDKVKVHVDLKKDLKDLRTIRDQLLVERDQLLAQIQEVKNDYTKNSTVFDEIFRLSNGGVGDEAEDELMDLEEVNDDLDEEDGGDTSDIEQHQREDDLDEEQRERNEDEVFSDGVKDLNE